MKARPAIVLFTLGCCLFVVLAADHAEAQMSGHNAKGDMGVLSGTQAPPGWYVLTAYLRYDGDSLRDRNGQSITIDPEGRGSLDVNAYVLGVVWTSEFKLFGANYGMVFFPALVDNRLQVPVLEVSERASTNLTDLYVQPVNLGWHTDRADFSAGLGLYVPIGKYDADADDNVGLGMWSFEVFGGTTLYFDHAKSWSFATTAFYEWHTEKEDSDMKVGDILTLEGGLGKSFMDGAVVVGIAYYAQWKMSDDDLGPGVELPPSLDKHKVYAFGPDITVPIATKKKLIAMLNARYLWESGARSTTEGSTFMLTATFPIPSVPLQ